MNDINNKLAQTLKDAASYKNQAKRLHISIVALTDPATRSAGVLKTVASVGKATCRAEHVKGFVSENPAQTIDVILGKAKALQRKVDESSWLSFVRGTAVQQDLDACVRFCEAFKIEWAKHKGTLKNEARAA